MKPKVEVGIRPRQSNLNLARTLIGHAPSVSASHGGTSTVIPVRLVGVETPPPSAAADASGAPPSTAAGAVDNTRSKRRRRIRGVLLGSLVLSLIAAYFWHAAGFESTDDARVDANISRISARVQGVISKVHIHAHQLVHAGDLLIELDPADSLIEVDAAKANLQHAEATLEARGAALAMTQTDDLTMLAATRSELRAAEAARAGVEGESKQLRAQLAQADAQQWLANSERDRAAALVRNGALADAELERRARSADAGAAGSSALREQLKVVASRSAQRGAEIARIQARLDELVKNSPRRIAARRAALDEARADRAAAKARVDLATTQLSYMQIYAASDGVIGVDVPKPGEVASPGQQLLSVCSSDVPWVTANFRETQLRDMHPGQPVEVYVDALARSFRGRVDSIAGATAARFSLFPPQNASGNFVKVVQRVPVKISFDGAEPNLSLLRAGMSVVPSVSIR